MVTSRAIVSATIMRMSAVGGFGTGIRITAPRPRSPSGLTSWSSLIRVQRINRMSTPPRPFPFPPCPPPRNASVTKLRSYYRKRLDYELRSYMARQPRLTREEAEARFPNLTNRNFPLRCRLFGHQDSGKKEWFEVPIEGHPSLWFTSHYCARCQTSYAVQVPAPPKGPDLERIAENLCRVAQASAGTLPSTDESPP